MTMQLTVSRFCMPSISLIGCGASKAVGDQLKAYGAKKALLVTDKGMSKMGVADTIKKYIEDAGLQAVLFDGAEPNPTDLNVAAGLKVYNENGCDSIVTLGGGSSHDCGKGIGVLVTNGGKIHDYAGFDTVTKPMPTFVAINTTAGTGSEMSPGVVITNTETHVKMVIWSINIPPNVAINDTELMAGMPPALTAATGMDALTHAVEAYVAAMANPKSDALALQAIKLTAKYLPQAVGNGQNLDARQGMAFAEYLAGEAFSSAGLGIAHSLAHQPGSFIGLPHGVCNAIFLPLVCEFNMIACVEKYVDVAEAMGVNVAGLTPRDAALAGIEAIRKLSSDIGIPSGLAELGMKESDIPKLAEASMKDVCVGTNPRPPKLQDMINLYKKAM